MIAGGDGKAMLNGVKVIDLTSVVFGPYCTQILADFGAEVIRIEPPGGDTYRYAGRPAKTAGMSPQHIALNRGKKSVVLDLKQAGDAGRLRELMADADIVIHNVRAEAIARLGFDYDAVRAICPNVIYAHCVGFGSGGEYGGLQAYDDVIQAASGTATLLPRVDGNPAPRYLPSLIADKTAGLHAAYAVMAAIIHRMRTGDGQFVEIPMFEAFTSFMLKEHLGGLTFDPPVGDVGYARQVGPDRQPFPTKDGHISIVPYRPEQFPMVIGLLGDPAMAAEDRFKDIRGIMAAGAEMYQRIAQLTPARTTADWLAVLREAQIPAMAVRDLSDMLDDPHLRSAGFFAASRHPTEGTVHQMREPSRFSAWSPAEPGNAPTLGQHNSELD